MDSKQDFHETSMKIELSDFGTVPAKNQGVINKAFDDTEILRDVAQMEGKKNLEPESADDQPKTSLMSTFINFMKANIGTGILAMPDAIKNGGLVVGSISLIFLGFLTTYCGHQLLHAYVHVSGGKTPMSFSQVTYMTFRRQGSLAKSLITASKYIIDVFIIVAQLGTCCIYMLAVSRMIREVVEYAIPTLGWDIRIYETLLLIPLIPSCYVTTLKVLSYIGLFANAAQITGLIIILQYVFRNVKMVDNLSYVPSSVSSCSLFFGTAMFAFSIAPFILPMEACMEKRKAFHGWDGLMSLGMSCVIVLYIIVGFYGYLAFGSEARMILSNLPPGDWLYNAVKLLMATGIFLSFNLQLFFSVQIIFPPLKRSINKPWFDRFGEYIIRTCLVLLTFAFAVSVPCLELMISLVGALAAGSLNLVVPPLLELVCSFEKEGPKRKWLRWLLYFKCGLMIAFGSFGCVIGSFVAIQTIATTMNSPEGCGK